MKYKVNLLTVKETLNAQAINLPLFLNRSLLKEMGINLTFFFTFQNKCYDCDVLILNSKYFISHRWKGGRSELFYFLEKCREHVGRLLWFDTTDSTGACQFEVLPYVDGYYKGQVLKNREDYLRKYYGYRIYTDFYHQHYGVEDVEINYKMEPPEKRYLYKIGISWNSSLGDYNMYLRYLYKLRQLSTLFYFRTVKFTSPQKERPVNISCRINKKYHRRTIAFHRERLSELLMGHFGVSTEKVSPRRYFGELKSTKIGISPFGNGEIAYRDFEIIINGAALFKPDMSHMETWPDLYREDETCIFFKWDLSDLVEKVDIALKRKFYMSLAENAQAVYKKYLFTHEGHQEFAYRVKNIVERVLDTSIKER